MSDFQKYSHIAKTILTSKNRTAYYVVWVKFLKLLFSPLDFILSKFENVAKKVEKPPMILVVGIQRTGSTFVSQILSNAFDFSEVGNFNSIFWRSRYFIHKWYNRFFKRRTSLKHFKSYYGISRGLSTIGDCYEVYDQWFGTDHYSIPAYLDDDTKKDMANYFGRLYQATGKPILAKNNRNTLLLKEWKSVFPNAHFVIVKRNLAEVVRSTVQASYDFFGDPPTLWGLYPKDKSFQLGEGSIIKQACRQCFYLEKELNEAIDQLDSNSYTIVEYEEFCQEPKRFLNGLRSAVSNQFKIDMQYSDHLNFEPFDVSHGGKKSEYLQEIETILADLEKEDHAKAH